MSFASVVIPVRNGSATIGPCIESLLRLTYPRGRFEILVVDNGSTDTTSEILQRYPVSMHLEPRPGSYVARNRGAALARGEILAFIDADCFAEPDWLSELVAAFDHSDVGCAAGRILSAPARTAVQRYAARRQLMSQEQTLRHLHRPYALAGNCAYRREVFQRLGGFRESLRSGGDADLSWRMQEQLGLQIEYRPGAVVRFSYRESLGAFMRQARGYAWGAMDLATLHGTRRLSIVRRSAGILLASSRAMLLLPTILIKRRRADQARAVDAWFEVVWRVGALWGILAWHARRMLGKRDE